MRAGMSSKKGETIRLDADAGEGGTCRLGVLGAGLLDDAEPGAPLGTELGQRTRHQLGEDARALAAAEDEQAEGGFGRRQRRRVRRQPQPMARTGLPTCTMRRRVRRSLRAFEAGGENRAERDQQPVGAAEHGVLLMHDDRQAGEPCGGERRNGRIAAEADDDLRAAALAMRRRDSRSPCPIADSGREEPFGRDRRDRSRSG